MTEKENTKVELKTSKKKKKEIKKNLLKRLSAYIFENWNKVFMNHMKFTNNTLQILCLLNI